MELRPIHFGGGGDGANKSVDGDLLEEDSRSSAERGEEYEMVGMKS